MLARMRRLAGLVLVFAIGCSSAGLSSSPTDTPAPAGTSTSRPDGGTDDPAKPARDGGTDGQAPPSGPADVRILAGNISSGNDQSYDPGEGIRMLQGLHPDIALLQETNYGTGTETDLRTFVTTAFGAEYTYFRESGGAISIPNAVVSRFPITESGRWADPKVQNRGFAWSKIAAPGVHPIWAVSVHFLTSNATDRDAEADALLAKLKEVVAEGDYVVIGGDLNTDSRTEPCLATLGGLVDAAGSHAEDHKHNENTNATRSKPYDWVFASPALAALQVPTVLGASNYPKGLVFDSRVYTPLAEVTPVKVGDSSALNMQHMPIVKDFHLGE